MASKFRVGHAVRFVSLIVAASTIATPESHPSRLYQLDDKISFNVLDTVIQDPVSGQITLAGHHDSRFATSKIPYLEHLATLLESPAPEFSLEWTSASRTQVDAMFNRLNDRQEMARMAAGWGRMFDANGDVTASGRYFLPLLGIQPTGGSWQGVDQFGRVAAMYRAAGNDGGAEAIELYGKLQHAIDKSAAEHGGTAESSDFVPILMEFIGVAGKMNEIQEVRERVHRGEMSRAEQFDAAFRILADSLDSGLGLSGSPAARAYSRARANGLTPGIAYDKAVVPEVNDQLQKVGHDILEKLFDRAGEIAVPPEVLAESAGVPRPEVVPTYYGVDPHSQLARLFFEADYLGKSLTNKPELTRTIPGYQTEFSYERSHPSISAERGKRIGDQGINSECRIWFTVDKVDLTEANDRKAVATKGARIKVNLAPSSPTNTTENSCPRGYGDLLTEHYDDLAQQFPILHELREAAKLAAVARWLKNQRPDLRFPRAGRGDWTGPERVPGLVFVAWSPHPPPAGAPAVSAIAEGGISFKLSPTTAVPDKGRVDLPDLQNCPDIPPPSGGAPVGWTTAGASGDVFAVTLSTKTADASDTQFLTTSPKGYNVLWSPSAGSTTFLSSACQQSLGKRTLTASNSTQSQYADLLSEMKPVDVNKLDSSLPSPPNFARDPAAARLNEAALSLVNKRIANLEKAIGILGSSNPEWQKERSILAMDFHEDRISLTREAIDLLTLGIAKWAESTTKANVSTAKSVALWQSLQRPLARLPAEEGRLTKLLNSTADPELSSAISKYIAALHRLEETQKYRDGVKLVARLADATRALSDEFELMKRRPPSREASEALYESSALIGTFALVFYENPVSIAGSALASFAVGGRALVNTWDENRRYDALMRDDSRRQQERHVLMFRLEDLRQQQKLLSSSLERSR